MSILNKRNRKIYLIVLLGLVVIIFAILFAIHLKDQRVASQQQETEELPSEMYFNEKYGFKFAYSSRYKEPDDHFNGGSDLSILFKKTPTEAELAAIEATLTSVYGENTYTYRTPEQNMDSFECYPDEQVTAGACTEWYRDELSKTPASLSVSLEKAYFMYPLDLYDSVALLKYANLFTKEDIHGRTWTSVEAELLTQDEIYPQSRIRIHVAFTTDQVEIPSTNKPPNASTRVWSGDLNPNEEYEKYEGAYYFDSPQGPVAAKVTVYGSMKERREIWQVLDSLELFYGMSL